MSSILQPIPLTPDNFAPYGQVIDRNTRKPFLINEGSTERYDALAEVETGANDGCVIISLFRKPVADRFPLAVTLLERHPQGSQAFIPLQGNPFLILVAPPGAIPDLNRLRLFISDGRQGVNYAAGVWHHPLITCVDGDELLVVDRKGALPNCDEFLLAPALGLKIQTPILD